MHRKPLGVKTPAELFEFDPAEWAAPDDDGSWRTPFTRWKAARHAWVEAHSDTPLGDMLDVLRGEVRVKRGLGWP
jgi:hypothetical protein